MPAKPNPDKFNWNDAFRERLLLEGGDARLAAYEAKVAEHAQVTGKHKWNCYQLVARSFGLVSQRDERYRWEDRRRAAMSAEDHREQRRKQLRAAISTRPAKADLPDEVEWVRNHPAMVLASTATKGDPIEITAEDVLEAAHGAAPSQASVGMLQNYVLDPAAFHKWYLGTYRKELDKANAEKEEEYEEEEEEGCDESLAMQEALAIVRQISVDAEKIVRKEIKAK